MRKMNIAKHQKLVILKNNKTSIGFSIKNKQSHDRKLTLSAINTQRIKDKNEIDKNIENQTKEIIKIKHVNPNNFNKTLNPPKQLKIRKTKLNTKDENSNKNSLDSKEETQENVKNLQTKDNDNLESLKQGKSKVNQNEEINNGHEENDNKDLMNSKIENKINTNMSSLVNVENDDKIKTNSKLSTKLNKNAKAFKDMKLEIEERKIDLNFNPSDFQNNLKIDGNDIIENKPSHFSPSTGTVSSFYKVDSNYETTDYETCYSNDNNSVSNSQAIGESQNYLPDSEQIIQDNYEVEKAFYEVLSQEIEQYTNEIDEQVDLINDYRNEIKYRIDKVVSMTFSKLHPSVDAYIYGSVATGIMLPESDMDIVVIGVSSFGLRDNHIANITALYDNICKHISEKVLIKSLKITQTQVPIIKLTFSCIELYNEGEEDENSSLPFVDFDSSNSCLKELSVDISICDSYSTSEHQGIKAAYFIQDCIEEIPVIKPVILVLK